MPDLAARYPRINARYLIVWRIVFLLRALWRHLRVTRPLTLLLGRQYVRSRDLIEIDITYACNLHCLNCNRSVTQAPDALHMTVEQVATFVAESIARGKRWRRIRVLGGEPTVHPQFREIIAVLQRYQAWEGTTIIEVVTNGHGPRVNSELDALPPGVLIDNSAKTSPIQPHFGPFNLAPVDDWRYRLADYSNACAIARDCGMGLTPLGYYPCAVAGGIDRISGAGLGRRALPDDGDDLEQAAAHLCRLCGRFRDGHFIPRPLRPRLTEEVMSPSWRRLYARWAQLRRRPSQDQEDKGGPCGSGASTCI